MNTQAEQKEKDQNGHPKQITITVNSRQKVVTKETMTYAEIVQLAFPDYAPGSGIVYTVTYWRKDGDKTEGSLVDGQTVKVKEGMIFDVQKTSKS